LININAYEKICSLVEGVGLEPTTCAATAALPTELPSRRTLVYLPTEEGKRIK